MPVGGDATFIQNDRKIFVPMGGWWEWHYGSPHWFSWENQTVTGLNVTINGSKSVMHFTESIAASSGSEIFFNIPFFYFNPSTGSCNLTDITWNYTKHNDWRKVVQCNRNRPRSDRINPVRRLRQRHPYPDAC